MSKKLKIISKILITLYIVSIMLSISPIYKMLTFYGFIGTVLSSAFLYIIVMFVLCFFLYKKNIKAIFVSFVSSLFILLTSTIFFNPDYGIIGSLKLVFVRLVNGHLQMFAMSFLAWLIPIVAGIGVVFYFIDQNRNSSKN
ncbi:hypothetical protein LO80_01460 [Candidatus Francisella endociliophora]|uniref:Uncharacterized protein n=1 Tax=Candidatus Francisella endociliophora TaxID=653937 RepID=A0A097EMH4_9GAMM|nr:hypothetical protein [Francisella sp. FSC1006]AIT08772.1 hypothetical protein LO80_01460 [Francisella sp. FSC1006]